jgi:hypothetical protein
MARSVGPSPALPLPGHTFIRYSHTLVRVWLYQLDFYVAERIQYYGFVQHV